MIKLIEEGRNYRTYETTSETDAHAFAKVWRAQSITSSNGKFTILVLMDGHYSR